MPQNAYECLFILDSNRYARDSAGVSRAVSTLIEDHGGEVLASRLWLEQRLAYPINGQRKGTYWLTYFRMDPSRLKEFNRACQLKESILRHLVLKVDPRLIDVLVDHALGKISRPAIEEVDTADEESLETGSEEPAELTAGS